MLVDPYYDVFQYQYSIQNSLVDQIEHQNEKDSGTFVPIYAALSRRLVLPETGEVIPFSKFDAGHLNYGISDPGRSEFNSLSDFYGDGNAVEVRIPWMLLNVRDPGTKNIIADWNQTGAITGQSADASYFGLYGTQQTQSVPFAEYRWESWDLPTYHERLKKSYAAIQAYFSELP
ncbi:hypothetical protein SDC9_141010 [bioreactor metagenome]|uniref:Uncharacterized protein n=1 Tax=bioreactor metagenome TaxID=1076179 RepID=A0A645DXK8_9ZZZZ